MLDVRHTFGARSHSRCALGVAYPRGAGSLGAGSLSAVWLGWAMLFGGLATARAGEQVMDEYKVKALYLYNFAKFVDWPGEVFQSPTEPISVCVVGTDPFGAALDETVKGKAVGDRLLVVQRLSDTRRASACKILFIGSSERKRLAPILEAVKAGAVLTVGETESFTKDGGVIRFLLEDGKVRFEINTEAAALQRLRLSSKLLNLARIVKK